MNKDGFLQRLLLPLTFLLLGFVQAASAESGTPTSEMHLLLNEYAGLGPRPFHILRVAEARIQPTVSDAVTTLLARSHRTPDVLGLARVWDTTVRTPRIDLPARVFRPGGDGQLPVILYFQGGGWVVGDIDVYETSAVALAKKTGAIVVSIEYRKAPENKFPSAHDDAFNSFKWLLTNAGSIGGDRARIAVAGEGAGGNLAVNVAIRARDEKLPPPRHVLAIYPIADGMISRLNPPDTSGLMPLTRSKMNWFLAQYFEMPTEGLDPRISLLKADVRKLPPTTVVTAELDPLKSEGAMLFQRLKEAGVAVEYRNYQGVTHEFFGAGDVLAEARAAQAFAAARIKDSFKQSQ